MMFSPVVKWEDAQVGDLGFYAGDEAFAKAIELFEKGLAATGRATVQSPGGPASVTEKFVPSHVFIVWDRYTVVEAWLAGTRNSAASLGPADKYARAMALGHVKLLRPPGHIDDKRAALHWIVNTYGGKSYGVLVLVGFALQETFHLKDNPGGYWGQVCSQTGWRFLSRHVWQMQERTPPAAIDQTSISAIESVLARVPLRDCEPLNLFVATTAGLPAPARAEHAGGRGAQAGS